MTLQIFHFVNLITIWTSVILSLATSIWTLFEESEQYLYKVKNYGSQITIWKHYLYPHPSLYTVYGNIYIYGSQPPFKCPYIYGPHPSLDCPYNLWQQLYLLVVSLRMAEVHILFLQKQ